VNVEVRGSGGDGGGVEVVGCVVGKGRRENERVRKTKQPTDRRDGVDLMVPRTGWCGVGAGKLQLRDVCQWATVAAPPPRQMRFGR